MNLCMEMECMRQPARLLRMVEALDIAVQVSKNA